MTGNPFSYRSSDHAFERAPSGALFLRVLQVLADCIRTERNIGSGGEAFRGGAGAGTSPQLSQTDVPILIDPPHHVQQ